MEALVILLVAVLIWRWFAWRKRFATLTSALSELHNSIAALRDRVAELERRVIAPPVAAEPKDLTETLGLVSERAAAAEVEKGSLARAIREAALQTPEQRVETPAEAQSFTVLKLREEAPPVAPGAVVEHAVEAPGVAPEPARLTPPPPVPPAPPPASVPAAPPIEVAHPVELLPPPIPAAQPTQTRAEAIRERAARLRERHAAAAPVSPAAKIASAPPPTAVPAEPPQRIARGEEISAAVRTAPRARRAWQWAAMLRRKTGEMPDWEALIGGSWLNVVGIVVFVLGMVLLAQYSLSRFPAAGKIATGVVIGFVLIGGGVRLERIQRYRLLGWTLVGGGWALLYFTAYAAYNIEASRIISEPTLGLVVLSIVAAGIIFHSLKYRSELVTGLAYGLGFLAVTITPLNAYTLVASALLAASQIVILRFFTWHYLALIAVAGTYLNHARWLGEIVGSQPDFWLSQAILAFYWALFIVMGLVRRPTSDRESLIHLTVNVVNTIGLLGLSAWQIWVLHAENLYDLTASALLAYVVAAGVSRISDRPDLLRFNGSVAVLLFALTLPLASGPLNISGHWFAIYWVVGGVLAVACGYRAREFLLRLEGYGLCGLGCLAVFTINLESALPFADWRLPHWWIAPAVVILVLGLSEFLQRMAGSDRMRAGADRLGQACGYAATAILAAFLWRVSASDLLGPSWLVAGLVSFEAGAGWRRPPLRNQGYALLGLAFMALLAINLNLQAASADVAAFLSRPVIVGLAAAAYYYLYWRLRRERCGFALAVLEPGLGDLCSVAGSALVVVLAWKELDPTIVAIAWIAAALVLFEAGARWARPLLRNQGYVLFGLAFAALLAINLAEIRPPSAGLAGAGLLSRPVTVGLAAAIYFYVFWRLRRERCGIVGTAFDTGAADLFSIAGSTLVALLAWKELDSSLVALAWIVLGLALFEVGAGWPRTVLRGQAYVLFGLAFAALLGINLYELHSSPAGLAGAGLLPRPVTVGVSAGVYYYLYRRLRGERPGFVRTLIEPVLGDWFSIAGSALVALLAWKELDSSLVALAWIVLGLALFEVGAGWPRTVLRGQAYVLFGLAFAALLGINLYELHSSPAGLAGAGLLPRPVTVGVSAGAYYYLYGRLRGERPGFVRTLIEPVLGDWFSIAGSALVAILAWKELDSGLVALTWIAVGLVLFEAGARWPQPLLRYQSYVLFGLAFASLMAIDLLQVYPAAVGPAGAGILPRPVVVGLAAAVYYVLFWRLRREGCGIARTAFEPAVADLLSIAATLLIAVLARKELDPAHVAVAWVLCGLVLFEVGAHWPRPLLRNQGYVLFAFAFAALLIVNLYEIGPPQSSVSPLPRWLLVGPSAIAAYWIFRRLQPDRRGFDASVIDTTVADFVSIAGTVLLTVLAWKELDSVSVALAWGVLALGLFEIGKATHLAQLTRQAHVLAALSFARLFMANFVALGQSMGISHRLLSVLPITALLYYLYVETIAAPRWKLFGRELDLSRLYVWAGAVALLALARFELGRAYAVIGMAPLFVAFMIVGRRFDIVDFRAQAYLLATLTFARCWATNAYLVGAAFGLPERVVTMVPVIVAFAVTTAICLRPTGGAYGGSGNIFRRALSFADANPQHLFAFLGAALTALLFYYELPIGWVTLALAIEALILILAGIATEQRSFRLYGLTLLLITLLKLVVIDVRDVEPIYRILSYIGVGLILLMASLLYTRYRSVVERYV